LEETWTGGIKAQSTEEYIWTQNRGNSMKKEKTTKREAPLQLFSTKNEMGMDTQHACRTMRNLQKILIINLS